MSGLFFLLLLIIWLAVDLFCVRLFVKSVPIKSGALRGTVALCLFTVLLVLPVGDEIVGGWQFRALCREKAVLHINAERAKGRVARVVVNPVNELLPGTAVPIYGSHESIQDVATNEEIASSDWYVAKGGWLIRTLGLGEDDHPLLIDSAGCSPPQGERAVAKSYGFTLNE